MPVRLKTPLSQKWEVVLSLGMVLPPMGGVSGRDREFVWVQVGGEGGLLPLEQRLAPVATGLDAGWDGVDAAAGVLDVLVEVVAR